MDRIRSKVSSGFKAGKCKTSLKLAVARIKLLKNKRETQVRQMRRDLAQLLESGQDQTARIRVEHVIREEKTVSAYELIEIYCELIVARLPIIEAQKNCPIDLKEAIAGLVFASPRCADLPELMDIRKHFVSKYGKEFVTAALEVRPECGVNRMLVEKLSAKAPDIEAKIHTLTAVAQEHNVKWDSKGLEEEFHKPSADFLNGPNSFGSASKMPIESTNSNLSSATNQKNDSAVNSSQNDASSKASKPVSMNMVSPAVNNSHSASVSSTSQHGSRAPDYTPSSQPVWHMDFKDATSAAQAAAESAEMASMAARAAVQLATRENISRQPSIESHESPSDDIRRNQPVKSTTSNPDGVDIVRGSTSKENESRRYQGMNVDDHNRQRDNASQRRESESIYRDPTSEHMSSSSSQSRGNISSLPSTGTQGMNLDDHHHQRDEAGQRRESESIYRDPVSKHLSSSSSPSRGNVSRQPSTGTQGMNLQRDDQNLQRDNHNLQRDEAGQRRERENIYGDPASKHMSSSSSQSRGNVSRQFSNSSQDLRHNKPDKSTSSKLDDADFIHVTNEEDELRSQAMNLEEQSLQMDEVSSRRETESIYDDRASPKGRPMSRSSSDSNGTSLIDNLPEMDFFKTDTNAYDHQANKDRTKGNVNSELGRWSTEESYSKPVSSDFTHSAMDADVFGGSTIWKQDSNTSNDSRTGNREGIFETDKKQASFKSDAGAVFDNYGSDTDDVNLLDSFLPHEEEPSTFSSNVDVFSSEQHRSDSLGGSKQHFTTKPLSVNNSGTTEDEFLPSNFDRLGSETTGETLYSPVSSGGYKKNRRTGQKTADKIWERSSSGDLSSRRNDKMPVESIDLDRPIYDYSNEEPRAWQPPKASETLETEEKDKFGMSPSHSHARATEISSQLNFETEQSLNLGRLTGGFKNKGFQRPPYVKTPSVEASVLSPQTSKETPFIVEKPSVTPSGNVYASPEEYVYNSRISKTGMDTDLTDLDKDNKLVSSRTSATKTSEETPFIVEKPSVTSSSNAYANPEEYVYTSRISKTGMDTDLDKDNELVSSRISARRGYRGKSSLPSENTTEVADDISRTPHRNDLSSNSSITSSNIEKIDLHRRAVGSRQSRDTVSVQPEPSRYVPPATETPKVESYDQRPHKKVSDELGLRDPLTYFKPDEDESLELNKPQIVGRAKKDIKLSWRTRNPPSDGTKNSHSRSTGGLEAENRPSQASALSETHSANLEEKVTSRSLLPKPSPEQPPVTRRKSESSADSGVSLPKSPKQDSSEPVDLEKMTAASSIDGSISRESSFGNASHVHPKLPDSDSFTAYFKSLRANRQ